MKKIYFLGLVCLVSPLYSMSLEEETVIQEHKPRLRGFDSYVAAYESTLKAHPHISDDTHSLCEDVLICTAGMSTLHARIVNARDFDEIRASNIYSGLRKVMATFAHLRSEAYTLKNEVVSSFIELVETDTVVFNDFLHVYQDRVAHALETKGTAIKKLQKLAHDWDTWAQYLLQKSTESEQWPPLKSTIMLLKTLITKNTQAAEPLKGKTGRQKRQRDQNANDLNLA